MHDLVVRQRQQVVLRERVHHRERQLVVVVLPVDRVMLHVAERVVHPAHVPLEAEPEAAQVHRPGDARPGGGLLGDHHDPGHALVAGGVDLLQERDRVEVLPPAERVGRPLAFLARVVEVEHRGDRVDPEPVDVELLEPVDRVGDEEVPDLGAAVVEDERAPVRVRAEPGVGVLVERGPVELGQRPGVAREVRGTQSMMTPMPAWCRVSTRNLKSSGEPNRDVGA